MTPKEIIDIETARRCLRFQGFKCNNVECLNKICPLNKFWDRVGKEKNNDKQNN